MIIQRAAGPHWTTVTPSIWSTGTEGAQCVRSSRMDPQLPRSNRSGVVIAERRAGQIACVSRGSREGERSAEAGRFVDRTYQPV